jgi:thymidylate synthase (FAD)
VYGEARQVHREAMMNERETRLLDHGYLRVIEDWGADERIIEAARMSTGKGFLGWGPQPCRRCGQLAGYETCMLGGTCENPPGDEKLLRYLYENRHSTPFEMAGMVVEVKAPISVFRQWHRHRTQSYNEMSARYTPLPDENYVPSVERLLMSGGTNKQAGTIKGAGVLDREGAEQYRRELIEHYESDERLYQRALAMGVPKELARDHLPVGRYSVMRASANLRNWLAFLTLRADDHAQWEIRQYAHALAKEIAISFPRTYALFAGAS